MVKFGKKGFARIISDTVKPGGVIIQSIWKVNYVTRKNTTRYA